MRSGTYSRQDPGGVTRDQRGAVLCGKRLVKHLSSQRPGAGSRRGNFFFSGSCRFVFFWVGWTSRSCTPWEPAEHSLHPEDPIVTVFPRRHTGKEALQFPMYLEASYAMRRHGLRDGSNREASRTGRWLVEIHQVNHRFLLSGLNIFDTNNTEYYQNHVS